MKVLGIETSCDETAAAVVENGCKLLSNVVSSSVDLHTAYGGVVPEIAARSHLEVITPVVERALTEAKLGWDDIDAIAVTNGPGLAGSLLIGVLTARTLAIAKNKPLYGVDHVHAHIFATFLTKTVLPGYELPAKQPDFPLLALIVSGGHTQLVIMKSYQRYKLLGQTADDAVGEAFDKVAQMLGLPYPGGPSISEAALSGDPEAVALPRAKMQTTYDFSFSGLKTAVLRAAQAICGKDYTLPSSALPELLSQSQKADLAASFQKTAVDTLVEAVREAEVEFNPTDIVVAGGVAANRRLRKSLVSNLKTTPIFPDIQLCTDNAAMVAAAGYFRVKTKQKSSDPYSLSIDPGLSMLVSPQL